MIQLSKNYSLPPREQEEIPVKIVGLGGAGSNALDRIVLDGMDKADLIAINTDVQSLASSVAAHKVQLGRSTTRGLGTGGDPELGREAALEAADEIRHALRDARLIFICAGLGGGTGSGAVPVIAQLAREAGSLVVAVVTLPFTFEGKRRRAQAQDALDKLAANANAVICFENDRLGDIVAPKAGIHQAFAAGDITISQSVRSIVNLIQRPGLIRLGFDDLVAALSSPSARCLFGHGESDSGNRAHDALTQALKSPLMDKGRMLGDAANVLVQIAGGPAMTLSEVEILMQELGKHVREQTQIIFGTSVDSRMGDRLSVTIISSLAGEEWAVAEPELEPVTQAQPEPVWQAPEPIAAEIAPEPEPILPPNEPVAEVEPAEEFGFAKPEPIAAKIEPVPMPPPSPPKKAAAAGPRLIPPKKKPLPAKIPVAAEPAPVPKPVKEKAIAKQEVLQFEPVTRGRFEKSEPTIVEGQDLDVPTFLRKNVRVK